MTRLLVTDLDNTLYDWVAYYVPAFRAMLHQLCEDTGVDEARLRQDFRLVHQRHGTVEYSFSVEELPVLVDKYGGKVPEAVVQRSAERFRAVRRKSLKLYPGVRSTLTTLRARGVRVVAYTEANVYHALDRLQTLGVLPLVDSVYASADHRMPNGRVRSDRFRSAVAASHEVDPHVRKPDPSVLRTIAADVGVPVSEMVYVGDSLSKDMLMAQRAGAIDVWARYGVAHNREDYSVLVSISHWTEAMVERERELQSVLVSPRFVLDRFSDVSRIACGRRASCGSSDEVAAGK